MRQKKRYALLKSLPERLPNGSKFLFQSELGYVVKVPLDETESLRQNAILISGSIRKIKGAKVLKASKAKTKVG